MFKHKFQTTLSRSCKCVRVCVDGSINVNKWKLLLFATFDLSTKIVSKAFTIFCSYFEEFSKLSIDDVKSRKAVHAEVCEAEFPEAVMRIDNLAVDLQSELPRIFHAATIQKKALQLLNSKESIVLYPALEVQENCKQFMVAGFAGQFHVVKIRQTKVTCDCKGFR